MYITKIIQRISYHTGRTLFVSHKHKPVNAIEDSDNSFV